MARTPAHVALLRGINLGGKNKLPMATLVPLVEAAGGTEVRTYIQSGNVVFRAGTAVAARLPAHLTAAIERATGLTVPVVLRSAVELAAAVRANPYPSTEALHLVFLADQPTAAAVASLDPARSPPDEYRVIGRDIYLRCPAGLGQSKLTNAYFDRRLSTVSTVRNWRTVTTLLEMVNA